MFGKSKISSEEKEEDLFVLLDENYNEYSDGAQFWRTLHKLDKEIEPGCIQIQDCSKLPVKSLRTGQDKSGRFKGEDTVVIRLKNERTAVEGAEALNKIFSGSGTRFIAEGYLKQGKPVYQIRSNIDKMHWEKLCVFSRYRFIREIPESERAKLFNECKETVQDYVKDTENGHWHAIEGQPAFCTLMGLHGVLRSNERRPPNLIRRELELNSEHPHGTPNFFEGIAMHANMQKNGDIMVVFDAGKAAVMNAAGKSSFWEKMLSTVGGCPFSKDMCASERGINGAGLALGVTGLATVGSSLVAMVGPIATGALGGAFFVVTYVDHHWRIVDRLSALKARSKTYLAEDRTAKVAQKWPELTPLQVPDSIHEAYTRGQESVKSPQLLPAIREAFDATHTEELARVIGDGLRKNPGTEAAEAEVRALDLSSMRRM